MSLNSIVFLAANRRSFFTFNRGEIVNTPDLLEALQTKKIFGAALDVFEGEKAFIFKDMTEKGYAGLHSIIFQASNHEAFLITASLTSPSLRR